MGRQVSGSENVNFLLHSTENVLTWSLTSLSGWIGQTRYLVCIITKGTHRIWYKTNKQTNKKFIQTPPKNRKKWKLRPWKSHNSGTRCTEVIFIDIAGVYKNNQQQTAHSLPKPQEQDRESSPHFHGVLQAVLKANQLTAEKTYIWKDTGFVEYFWLKVEISLTPKTLLEKFKTLNLHLDTNLQNFPDWNESIASKEIRNL